MRDQKGRFIKNGIGYWKDKKRPNLVKTGAAKTMFKPGIRTNPKTEFKKGQRPWNYGQSFQANEKHWNWKGSDVGYPTLHTWLERQKGIPIKCDKCGFESEERRKIQWANTDGLYRRNLDDYIALCGKCHFRYDRQDERPRGYRGRFI